MHGTLQFHSVHFCLFQYTLYNVTHISVIYYLEWLYYERLCYRHRYFWKMSSNNDFWYSSQRFSTTNFWNDCSTVGLDPFREHTVRPQMFDALCFVRNAEGTNKHLTSVVATTKHPERLSPVNKNYICTLCDFGPLMRSYLQ